jgi:pantoate--beta-alanine ligase
LAGDARRAATVLYRSLDATRRAIESGERNTTRLLEITRAVLASEQAVAIDYVEIVDTETLEPVRTLRRACYILIAAVVGGTRLIDNALVEEAAGRDGVPFLVTV